MWNKIKIIGLFILLALVSIAAFVLGSRSNGGGVSTDPDLPGDITDGIDRSTERNDEAQRVITESRESADRASSRIGSAQNELRAAIEVLRRAKEKDRPDMD